MTAPSSEWATTAVVTDRLDAAGKGERLHVRQNATASEIDRDEPRLEIGGHEHDRRPAHRLGKRTRSQRERGRADDELSSVHTPTTSLAAGEVRLALLDERVQALGRVLRRAREVERAALELETDASAAPRTPASTASFARRSATGLFAAISRATRFASSSHASRATTRATQARAQRLVRAEEPPGQDDVHGHRLADGERQPLRAAGARAGRRG